MTHCPDCGKPLYEDSIHTCTSKALRLAQEYADAVATHRLENLYGTSRSYTLEKARESDEAFTALDAELRRLHAENEALQADAKRLDWLQNAADARKVDLAKSIYKTGYEIGEWPSLRVTVKSGTLRDAIDAAMKGQP